MRILRVAIARRSQVENRTKALALAAATCRAWTGPLLAHWTCCAGYWCRFPVPGADARRRSWTASSASLRIAEAGGGWLAGLRAPDAFWAGYFGGAPAGVVADFRQCFRRNPDFQP